MKKGDWYKKHMRCLDCKILVPRPSDVNIKYPNPHPRCPQCNRPLRLRPPRRTLYRDMGKRRMRTECIYMMPWQFAEKLRNELKKPTISSLSTTTTATTKTG